MFSKLSLITLALQFLYVFGAPSQHISYSCPLTGDTTSSMKLPAGFPSPSDSGDLSYVAVALGTQNYTCSSTGTYTNIGALAELFDISCLTHIPFLFDRITDDVISVWEAAPKSVTPQEVINTLGMFNTGVVLGQHYYVSNPTPGSNTISPKWDFTSSTGNPDAYIIASKSFGSPAPTGTQDIDWVFLTNIAEGGVGGQLASGVYRTDTKLGQPPMSSCTPGSEPIEVRYASKYWLIGGSIKKN